MKTVVETPTFTKQVDKIWSEDERLEFVTFIAKNPTAGDVIPSAEGQKSKMECIWQGEKRWCQSYLFQPKQGHALFSSNLQEIGKRDHEIQRN